MGELILEVKESMDKRFIIKEQIVLATGKLDNIIIYSDEDINEYGALKELHKLKKNTNNRLLLFEQTERYIYELS